MGAAIRILVTGGNGQLGSEIRNLSTHFPGFQFFFTDQGDLEITDEAAVIGFFQKERPHYCINCAAYTAVDQAEDPAFYEVAEKVNATAVGILAQACTQFETKLVHISTDYVFDGRASSPYLPYDAPNPLSVYGSTKLKGEHLAATLTDAIIIRTAWVYSAFGKNFVKTMIRLMQEKPAINVVSDQYGSPTYAADLAAAILHIIQSGAWVPGIYHYTNEGVINWFEFALAIKTALKSPCEVNAIPSTAYPTPATRPAYSVLDKSSIKEVFQVQIPDWQPGLQDCLNRLAAD